MHSKHAQFKAISMIAKRIQPRIDRALRTCRARVRDNSEYTHLDLYTKNPFRDTIRQLFG